MTISTYIITVLLTLFIGLLYTPSYGYLFGSVNLQIYILGLFLGVLLASVIWWFMELDKYFYKWMKALKENPITYWVSDKELKKEQDTVESQNSKLDPLYITFIPALILLYWSAKEVISDLSSNYQITLFSGGTMYDNSVLRWLWSKVITFFAPWVYLLGIGVAAIFLPSPYKQIGAALGVVVQQVLYYFVGTIYGTTTVLSDWRAYVKSMAEVIYFAFTSGIIMNPFMASYSSGWMGIFSIICSLVQKYVLNFIREL